jgi:hypothetical protein
MTTERPLSQAEADKAIDFMRRCASRGEAVTWAHAIRFAKYAKDPRDDEDDRYDDEDPDDGQVARGKTKPLRLTDDDDSEDDSAPRPRVVKEPQVVRRPDRDVEDADDDDDGAGEDRRGSRRARPKPQRRRPELDAMLERVTAQPCASCGKTPAGSAEIKVPAKDEREDLDPDKGAYLIPLCPDCKNSPDGQEAAEVEVHKRHARENGDCNKYSRSVRLFNEARDRRDR